MRRMHFIAGLPRAGSTLLSALLRQNPRFHAGVTSPLATLSGAILQKMGNGEFSVFFDERRRLTMLRELFLAYYVDIPEETVVFDTNRSWTGKLPMLLELFPEARIICCVREIGWILDSLERLRRKHPLHLSKLVPHQATATVYTRADALMNTETGLVGLAWSWLREAWFSEQANRLIVVPYEVLARQPERTLRRIYQELGEEDFQHDLHNLCYAEPDYDEQLGTPGLHTVRPAVVYEERTACIPPDLLKKYVKSSFWADAAVNMRGRTVL